MLEVVSLNKNMQLVPGLEDWVSSEFYMFDCLRRIPITAGDFGRLKNITFQAGEAVPLITGVPST